MSSVSTGPVEGEASASQGKHPDENVPHAGLVTDPEKDVAINEQLEKITVGVPGRRFLQTIYVRKSLSGAGKTTASYKPEEDAPDADKTLSIIPTKEEVESRADTMEFLVVGLVLAREPAIYSTKFVGASRNKQREGKLSKRGVLPAEKNVLRAIVPVTDYISTGSIKYYVACKQLHGLCNMRVIPACNIFYFSEIWEGIPENLRVKERRTQLGAACKRYAARDKKPPQRAQIPIATGSDLTLSNPIQITQEANAANVLLMQYSIYAMSRDSSALVGLKKTLEGILPDLLKKPSDEGLLGFYEFDRDLENGDAIKIVEAVMVTYPTMPFLDPALILELHTALRRTGLGGKLPYQSAVAFLRWGHDRAVAGWDPERLDKVVMGIIRDIEIMNEVNNVATTRTVSKLNESPVSSATFLAGLKTALEEIVIYFNNCSKALREQHGGVTKHASIEELMIKIGNCVDKTALMILHEQVFAIHAEQLATANSNGIRYIEECIGLIDQALAC